jgi:NADH-quinone oxidoreductase subunit J
VGIGGLLVSLLGRATLGRSSAGLEEANIGGNVPAIAALLFSRYVWAFEVVSALLITAALGAMVLAHHQRVTPRATQKQLAVMRFRGKTLSDAAGLPAPGVFARHNAVDVPALLPDGSPATNSITKTLRDRGSVVDPRPYQLSEIKNSDSTEGEER